ncbi:MAG: ATP-binding cassette domain-containing protein, partial [Gemmatimonadetes bacterium]|nr:ATP-binding cassette domain-containing protein [Gemmatimonadota bacterium]
MHPAFRCTGLSKSYPGFRLGPLDLALQPGTVLGYLGPNGSGKTTTMHCLAGLLRPDTGQTEVYGHIVDISESGWKTDVAYVSNRQSFYERWSGGRNLAFLS